MANAPSPGGVPPGWYPDPRNPGREQWWSGASWTQDFQPAGMSARYPVPVHPSPPRGPADRPGARPKASTSTQALLTGISSVLSLLMPLTLVWAWVFSVLVSITAIFYGIAGVVQSTRTGEGLTKSIFGLIMGTVATVAWALAIFAGGYLDRFSL